MTSMRTSTTAPWESIATDSTVSSVPTWARSDGGATAVGRDGDDPSTLASEAPSWIHSDTGSAAVVVTDPNDVDDEHTSAAWIGSMEPMHHFRRYRRRYLVVLLGIVLLISLILGVVLGTRNNDNGGDTDETRGASDSDTGVQPSTGSTGATLPPATVSIETPAPSISPTISPTSAPSRAQPTPAPTTPPPTLFPTFEGQTLQPTPPEILESIHSVIFGSSVSDCLFSTPPLRLSCSNGGKLLLQENSYQNIDKCILQSDSVATCTKLAFLDEDGYLVFSCQGTASNHLTATASLPASTATQCDAEVSNGVFRVTYGGEAAHYILLQRFCNIGGDEVVAVDGYPCISGEAGITRDNVDFCYSYNTCEEDAACIPFYPFCGQETCSVPVDSVRVSDEDSRAECRFS